MMKTLELQPTTESENADLAVADAVWVGTALMHQSTQSDHAFSTEEIVNFVIQNRLTTGAPKSIWQHVNQHCVANRKPQPNRSCMLFAKGRGDRRLFRRGDTPDPARVGAPTHPVWEKLPPHYAHLRDWYEKVWNKPSHVELDPLLALASTGRDMWSGMPVDEYVSSLREGWDHRA